MTKPGPKPKSRAGAKPGTRRCAKCGNDLPKSEFYVHRQKPDGLYPECKACVRITRNAFYAENKKRIGLEQRSDRRRRRKMVLDFYGHKCACCGESRYEFLAIDHIEGGGLKHIRSLRSTGGGVVNWLIKHQFPPGFRVLCHNCNFAMGHYGYCPHDGESIRMAVTATQPFVSINGKKPDFAPRWDNEGGTKRSRKTSGSTRRE